MTQCGSKGRRAEASNYKDCVNREIVTLAEGCSGKGLVPVYFEGGVGPYHRHDCIGDLVGVA